MIRDAIAEQGRFAFLRLVVGGTVLALVLVFGFPLAAWMAAMALGIDA